MPCKYFYPDTDICVISAQAHFAVWFMSAPNYKELQDLGQDCKVYRSIGSNIVSQYDVCPLQGEADGESADCPFYRER